MILNCYSGNRSDDYPNKKDKVFTEHVLPIIHRKNNYEEVPGK